MDMKPPGVVTIAGDAEVDHAIATLVLAFVCDREHSEPTFGHRTR